MSANTFTYGTLQITKSSVPARARFRGESTASPQVLGSLLLEFLASAAESFVFAAAESFVLDAPAAASAASEFFAGFLFFFLGRFFLAAVLRLLSRTQCQFLFSSSATKNFELPM